MIFFLLIFILLLFGAWFGAKYYYSEIDVETHQKVTKEVVSNIDNNYITKECVDKRNITEIHNMEDIDDWCVEDYCEERCKKFLYEDDNYSPLYSYNEEKECNVKCIESIRDDYEYYEDSNPYNTFANTINCIEEWTYEDTYEVCDEYRYYIDSFYYNHLINEIKSY